MRSTCIPAGMTTSRRRWLSSSNDAVRLRLMRALIARGHGDRIVISHDICYRTRLTRFGGHGFQHIFANVIPMMRWRGYSR